jgi:hypothetical protein
VIADDLAPEGAPAECLAALRRASGEHDGPMERHTVRQFLIAERLAHEAGTRIDRELLLCAAFLHDAGLYAAGPAAGVYTADGRRLALDTVAKYGWSEQRRRLLGDAIEQHHALTSRVHLGAEVELMRRSDLVDVSRGIIAFGLSRAWLRGLFAAVPRTGFWVTIGHELRRMVRERPSTMPRIFAPPSGGRPA